MPDESTVAVALTPIEVVILRDLIAERLAEALVNPHHPDLFAALTEIGNKLGMNL